MFIYRRRQADPIVLADQFTPEETVRITRLQGLFRTYPVCYTFDINYRRLEFARWLRDHGRLDEWDGGGTRADHDDIAPEMARVNGALYSTELR